VTDQSHLPADLVALIREADAIMTAGDAELVARAKRDGWEHCRARARAIMDASTRLGEASSAEANVDLKLADAWLSNHCAEAAERLINAAMAPPPRQPSPSLLAHVWALFRRLFS
jgi:hypothetical protein